MSDEGQQHKTFKSAFNTPIISAASSYPLDVMLPALPSGWSLVAGDQPLCVRPAVGSERDMFQFASFVDGEFDCCFGFAFTTSVPSLPQAVVEALVRLRFIAPLIASDIQTRPELSGEPCWIYKPMTNKAEALAWGEASLTVHQTSASDDDIISDITKMRLPYHLLGGHLQRFGCHLVMRPDGHHTILTHGAHAILDAHPNLYALRYVFQALVDATVLPPLETLNYGSEVANLPVDIVHLLGEEQLQAAKSEKLKIFPQLSVDQGSVGVEPQRKAIIVPAHRLCVRATIDAEQTRRLLATLKRTGFSMTVLYEAAIALNTLRRKTDLSADAQYVQNLTMIALERYFPTGYAAERHIASCMSYVSTVVPARAMSAASNSAQLRAAMETLRDQYAYYLAQPALPLANVVGAPQHDVAVSPHRPIVTNIGVVERFITPSFGGEHAEPALTLQTMLVAQRLTAAQGPVIHAWTFKDEFTVQIQALDIFDKEYLQSFLDDIISTMYSILEGDTVAEATD